MKKAKSIISLLISIIMVVSLVSIGFADNDKDKVAKGKVKTNPIEKIQDKDKDKIFDNLNEKLSKKNVKDELSVIIVFKEMLDKKEIGKIEDTIGKFKIKHKFKTIPSIAASLTKSQITQLSSMEIVEHIEYDMEVKASNDTAREWFGATKSSLDFGVNGDRDGNLNSYSKNDVVVAVIDTGIDANHIDLDNGKVIAWKDYVKGNSTPYDDNGHGTHVSGIIAGEGDGNSNYKGVAEGAALIGLKVLDRRGSGDMSDSTAALDWCIANKDTYGIDVVNMSLGTSGSSDGTDATSLAVNRAVDAGIVVVIAAGNSGPAKYTIGSPGAAEDAITVGAMADIGEGGFNLTDFSSRGPTADGRIKPDISAPGYNIMAAKANSSSSYVSYSGTSMATPFTAGTVALMLDANPSLNPTQIKNILMSTSIDMGPNGKDIEYGMGRLDVFEAVKSAGGYSGTNISVPDVLYGSDKIDSSNGSDVWRFNVDDTTYPISITLVMPNWTSSWYSSTPDFDIYLYDSNGNEVANSLTATRQENITFTPTSTGSYTLEVYSYSGTGSYFFDISTDGSSLTLLQNQ
ncbi:S8 family serine peptidase [Clostridium sp. D2Q-11]|uniref:S8 family serine peptidase n=1 Tax=Anaeromonas frigoriresistens TaxID=2683708 RepID=A0A942Z733_9FIRM|nr:S8 family serine peptidase [Anaeromonas frigoriresistens]MBS4539121.1 S8 family serine peptidase [Anaeromonas frigoriresistens]